MSAVINPPPSALLRRPPPAPIAAEGWRPAQVRITGRLLEHAVAATEPATGRAAYTVIVGQPGGAPPIVATRWVGDGPDAGAFARDRAAELARGDAVILYGDGLHLRYRDGALAIVLAGVRGIERNNAP